MIKVVCFDLDGTLVDSEEVILKTFDHVFELFFPSGREELTGYRKYMGPHLTDTFSKFTDDNLKIQEAIKEYIRHYKTIELGLIKPYKNINSTLDYISKKGLKIALITNKRYESSIPSMKYFDIYKYFDYFMAYDNQSDRPKPDPYSINLIMKEYNVKSDEIIMVGDNAVDVMCGKNAHAHQALVSYNPWFIEAKESNPEYILKDMSDLIKIIEEIK